MGAKEKFMDFWKDGKKVDCRDAYDARVGQILVLAGVSYEGCKEAEYPQMHYPQPSFFTVVEKLEKEGHDHPFILQDTAGNEIKVRLGIGFHDAQEWALWSTTKQAEDLRQKNARIQHVESQVALLRGILVEQGVKIVTTEEAKRLGISTK